MKKKGKKKSWFKGFSKPLGRFLRWSVLALFCYLFFINAHIRIELNKPNGLQEIISKVGWASKIIRFIRAF